MALHVCGGILACALTVLGVLLTTDKPVHRRFVYMLGIALLIDIVAIGVMEYKSSHDSAKRMDEMAVSIAGLEEKTKLWFDIRPTEPPDSHGYVTLPFTIVNHSGRTGSGAVYVHICEACSFPYESPSFVNFSGLSGKDRVMQFEHLDPGTHTDLIKITFKAPSAIPFVINLYYSCQFCGADSTEWRNWQPVIFPPYYGLHQWDRRRSRNSSQ
jgi:hypothetical protein